ncbi:MAG: hypothetical protein J3K34DRAFT_132385 [Monoraphidium minutum]|nr:MAG: hypothetical protein J3K34DRAFT_132385 [Monoraphidium minutum]
MGAAAWHAPLCIPPPARAPPPVIRFGRRPGVRGQGCGDTGLPPFHRDTASKTVESERGIRPCMSVPASTLVRAARLQAARPTPVPSNPSGFAVLHLPAARVTPPRAPAFVNCGGYKYILAAQEQGYTPWCVFVQMQVGGGSEGGAHSARIEHTGGSARIVHMVLERVRESAPQRPRLGRGHKGL